MGDTEVLRFFSRQGAEARLPQSALFSGGWPLSIPSIREATVIAEVRTAVSDLVGFNANYLTADSVQDRYAELLAKRAAKKMLN